MRGPIPRPIRASDELTWVVLWRASKRADGNRKARNAIHELRGVISKLPPEHCNRGIHPAPLLLPAQAKGKKLWRNDDQVTGSRYVIVSLGRSREIKVVSDLAGGWTCAPAGPVIACSACREMQRAHVCTIYIAGRGRIDEIAFTSKALGLGSKRLIPQSAPDAQSSRVFENVMNSDELRSLLDRLKGEGNAPPEALLYGRLTGKCTDRALAARANDDRAAERVEQGKAVHQLEIVTDV